jgi:hypothetical protein
MKQISVIFSKRSTFNLFSSAIMFGLKTPFSHVAIKMTDNDTGQLIIYQASGLNINCVVESEFLLKEVIVYEKIVQISDNAFIAGKTFIISQLGKPYYLLAILGFAIQISLGVFGIKISNPARIDGSEYVCSQLGAAYVEACDNIELDIRNMSPLALYNAVQSLPDVWS